MNQEDRNYLNSCIQQTPFSEEQAAFLHRWALSVTQEQVDSINAVLPQGVAVSGFESDRRLDGGSGLLLPVALLTDEVTYANALSILQGLSFVEVDTSVPEE